MAIKRQTARICRISDLSNGNYIVKEGWDPNYVETEYGKISRSNLMAVVVSKQAENSITVDDGTGTISLRFFDNDSKIFADVGDAVHIIGRPRMFNNVMFIVPEIIKKIDNKKWIEYRKLELELRKIIKKVKKQEPQIKVKDTPQPKNNYYELILENIRKLDIGNGAGIDQVIKGLDKDKAEKMLSNLFEEGEIFEIKPGFVKVLE